MTELNQKYGGWEPVLKLRKQWSKFGAEAELAPWAAAVRLPGGDVVGEPGLFKALQGIRMSDHKPRGTKFTHLTPVPAQAGFKEMHKSTVLPPGSRVSG